VLRLYGPVLWRPRVAGRDVQLGSAAIKQGEQVLTMLTASSRDGEKYACPHMVDLERKAPRDHLQFFFGQHTCPGQALGRAELEVATTQMLDRMFDMRLDPGAQPPGYEGIMTRRWHPLNVVFTPGPKLGA
jgi:cytochrome P450